MTKSFQSIRQLMARVLGKPAVDPESQREYSTLGLEPTANGAQSPATEVAPHSSVFVEAPMMAENEPEEDVAPHCSTDVDMQTADTQQLHPVAAAAAVPETASESDPEENEDESEAVSAVSNESSFSGVPQMNQTTNQAVASAESGDRFGDAFLDLGDFHSSPADHALEDSILDLDGDTTASVLESPAAVHIAEAPVEESELVAEPAVESDPEVEVAAAPIEDQEWASVPEAAVEEIVEPAVEPVAADSSAGQVNLANLSPEMIDVIARRVVAQLSDKVIREIAWEVVPELAELLIKEKRDEQS